MKTLVEKNKKDHTVLFIIYFYISLHIFIFIFFQPRSLIYILTIPTNFELTNSYLYQTNHQ